MISRLSFNEPQRKMLANKFTDLGNIAVGGLVFGSIVRSDLFNFFSLILGLALAVSAYLYAVALEK